MYKFRKLRPVDIAATLGVQSAQIQLTEDAAGNIMIKAAAPLSAADEEKLNKLLASRGHVRDDSVELQ